MPALLFINTAQRSKALKLTLILIFSPLFFWGQTLTGLWTGALHNDSSTIRKDQSFEIALTEYNGKVYGYSRSEFIVDDTLYYILKRVKGTIEGDICEVKDDEIISYNFRGKLDKGIKVTSTFRRNQNDSTWYLDGTWKTNATKKYYAVSGKVNLTNEKDLSVSKLFPHLEELTLSNDVAFYKDRTETIPVVRIAKPERVQPTYTANKDNLTGSSASFAVSDQPAEPVVSGPATLNIPSVKKQEDAATKQSIKEIEISSTAIALSTPAVTAILVQQPVKMTPAENDLGVQNKEKTIVSAAPPVTQSKVNDAAVKKITAEKNTVPVVVTKTAPSPNEKSVLVNKDLITKSNKQQQLPVTAKDQPVSKPASVSTGTASQPVATAIPSTAASAITTKPVTAVEKENTNTIASPVQETSSPKPDITAKAAVIAGRKSDFSQIVNFKSDSLTISLYDNGEIDGDTVSVFLNGEVILAKQGLKSSAIKKTIYVNRGQDEDFTLVMFAESLGKYPPNTGLLVIRDGDDVYNLRFSSDFQKNAGIVFRKKK